MIYEIGNNNSNNKFYVVSYFTRNYHEYYVNFKNSLNDFNVKYFIKELQGEWEWKRACNYKAEFILDCLDKFKSAVLWIDIDAIIHSNLNYFNRLVEENIDIGFYYRDSKELLSGTLFFNDTENSRKVLELWKKQSKNINMWDQRNLHRVLCMNHIKNLKINYFPVEYCYFDLLKNRLRNDKIHIEHLQASRKFNPDHPIYGRRK